MKALVTGASGFIGSTLIHQLNAEGITPFALLRDSSSTNNLIGARYERIHADLADAEGLKKALLLQPEIDTVFHLAGAVTARDSADFFKHNTEGTRNILNAAAACKNIKTFVFVSSLAASGPADALAEQHFTRTENMNNDPVSAYGRSKLAAEKEVLNFIDRFTVRIIRPPMVVGPKDKATFLFVKTANGKIIPVFEGKGPGNGKKHYSVVHSEDLCRALVLSAKAPASEVASGEAFFICSDDTITFERLMHTLSGHLGNRPFFIRLPDKIISIAEKGVRILSAITGKVYPLNADKLFEIAPDYWTCSNEKAKKMLQFTPQFTIEHALTNAADWYRAEKWI